MEIFLIILSIILSSICLIDGLGKMSRREFEHKFQMLQTELALIKKELFKTQPVNPQKEQPATQQQPVPPAGIPVYPKPQEPVKQEVKSPAKERSSTIGESLINFFSGGNLVFRIGGSILFLGIVFLIKYAADNNLLPLEYRLLGVGLMALILMGFGISLQKKSLQYALFLQGLSLAIIYLDIFAAYRIYNLIPANISFILLVITVLTSMGLAIRANSLPLALTGFLGGFLVPLLINTGTNNHVALFTYYAALDIGILLIAFFRSWKILNLLGFIFTYGIGAQWWFHYYKPEFFNSPEPFIIIFFFIFFIATLLSALRQKEEDTRYTDTLVIFGVPFITLFYQSVVLENQYATAAAALTLGLIYLGSAYSLRKLFPEKLLLLAKGFLAIGIILVATTIPLALEPMAGNLVLALEGAGITWFGLKQKNFKSQATGFLIILISSFNFLINLDKIVWIGFFMAASQFFLSYLYQRDKTAPLIIRRLFEHWFQWVAYLLWYLAGVKQLSSSLPPEYYLTGLITFGGISTLVWTMGAKLLNWPSIRIINAITYPYLILLFFDQTLYREEMPLLLLNTLPLILCLAIETFDLRNNRAQNTFDDFLHAPYLYTLMLTLGYLFTLSSSLIWEIFNTEYFALNFIYQEQAHGYVWGIVLLSCMVLLALNKQKWPFMERSRKYLFYLSIPVFYLLGWCWLVASKISGQNMDGPHYIPLFNSLDILAVLIFAFVTRWYVAAKRNPLFLNTRTNSLIIFALIISIFFWLNLMLARTVADYGDIIYTFRALSDSPLFQALDSLLWTIIAMGLMFTGTKKANRILWQFGMGLLILTVIKLVSIDMKKIDSLYRIVAFIGSGLLILVSGYFSPLPPKKVFIQGDTYGTR